MAAPAFYDQKNRTSAAVMWPFGLGEGAQLIAGNGHEQGISRHRAPTAVDGLVYDVRWFSVDTAESRVGTRGAGEGLAVIGQGECGRNGRSWDRGRAANGGGRSAPGTGGGSGPLGASERPAEVRRRTKVRVGAGSRSSSGSVGLHSRPRAGLEVVATAAGRVHSRTGGAAQRSRRAAHDPPAQRVAQRRASTSAGPSGLADEAVGRNRRGSHMAQPR